MSRLICYKKKSCPNKSGMPSLILRLIWILLLNRNIGRGEISRKSEVWESIQGAATKQHMNGTHSDYISSLHSRQSEGIHFERHKGLVLDGKIRNRLKKMINGNGFGQQISLIHWNMGARYWLRKLQCRRNFRKWVSPEVKAMMDGRDQLRMIASASGRVEDWTDFKAARNKVVKKTEELQK